MRIVHALGWYFPESLGGTEVYVAGVCRRLKAAGHDVLVAAPEAGRAGATTYAHEGTTVFRYPVPGNPTRDEAQGVTPARGAEQFGAWLASVRPDVLHVHSLVTGLGVHELRAAHALGIPIVLTHHLPSLGYVCRMGTLVERGVTPCDGRGSVERCAACVLVSRGLPLPVATLAAKLPVAVGRAVGAIPGPLGTTLGMTASIERDAGRRRELSALVDYQVVLNEVGRRILLDDGVAPERVVVNRLGTDHQAVVRKPPVDVAPTTTPVRLGYLGRIDRFKGVRELMMAVARVPADVPLRLDVVGPVQPLGDPGFAPELARLASADARITCHPPVASVDVPALLATWDVLCCPSTGFENGPTVALEAMAVGTPILATRIGNMAELVEDGRNARLVPPGDIEALAGAVREMAENPSGTIDRWRQQLPAVRTLNQIVNDYQSLYGRLSLARARAS